MSITRRRLFALSGAGLAGGGAAVLSACGDSLEEPSAERDVELLNAALAAQRTMAAAYQTAEEFDLLSAGAGDAVNAFSKDATAQVRRLEAAVESAGGTPLDDESAPPAAENPLESIALALNDAIAAYRAAAGALSTPGLNRTALELMATDAAQLAALRGELGENQAPQPFVTGLDDPPLVGEPQT
jgi:Ferritin-like domain